MLSSAIKLLLSLALFFTLSLGVTAQTSFEDVLDTDIEGNWLVEWQGSDPEYYTKAVMIFQYPRELDCIRNEQENCDFRQRISAPDLLTSGRYCCDASRPNKYISRSIQNFGFDSFRRTILIEHSYSALENGGGEERAMLNGSGISGEWITNDNSGRSVWTKLRPVITSLNARTYYEWQDDLAWVVPSSPNVQELTVGMEWHPNWEIRDMARGLRPEFVVELFGPNFLAEGQFYNVEFPSSPGIEPIRNWVRPGVLNVELILWPGVRPGKHTMLVDGVPVIINLVLKGYQQPAELVRIGGISIAGNVAKIRDLAAEQAVADARFEVESVERSIARQEAELETALNNYVEEAKPVQARLLARIEALGDDQAQIANERRYTGIELRSLAGNIRAKQTVLEETRQELLPLREALLQAETAADENRYAGLPKILKIETDASRIVATESTRDEMIQIEALLLEFNYSQIDLARQRSSVLAALEDAINYASEINNDVRNSSIGSYTLQAFAQAAVQIADAAVASKGNPLAFASINIVQAANNVFLSKPTYYDGELGEDGEITVRAAGNRTSINAAIAQSTVNTLTKSGIGELTQRLGGRLARESAIEAAEGLISARSRRVIGRAISQDLETLADFKSGNLIASVIEGILLDFATEGMKKIIAEEMTEGALRAYANAQMSVSGLTLLLRQIYQLEDMDAQAIAGLERRKAELIEDRARILPGLERLRPPLEYQLNDSFEVTAETEFRIELSPDAPPYDLFIEGVKAETTSRLGVFLAGTNVVSTLKADTPERISLEIRLR